MKLGIFGGTFDPIHRGHLVVAKAAADEFHLDRVLMIPSGSPPHKRHPVVVPFDDRYRMVELACQHDPRLQPSRLEAPDGGREHHYSIETIQQVRAEMDRGDELFFIIGADAFAEITLWRRWREVMELVEFIVVSRPGADRPDFPQQARVHWLGDIQVPVSSTEIRKTLHEGHSAKEYLPSEVASYIRERQLYQAEARSEFSTSKQCH